MKRLFYFIAFICIFGLGACTSDDYMQNEISSVNDKPNVDNNQTSSTRASNEQQTSVMVANLMESFNNGKSRSLGKTYPDYYGGIYADPNGILNILITGDTILAKENLIERCKSDNFTLKTCEYSFNELKSILDKLYLYQSNKGNNYSLNMLQMIGYCLLDNENKIGILLGDCSDANIERFKKSVMDYPCLKFIKSGPIKLDGSIEAGSEIGSPSSYGSVGYRAQRYGINGVVVSAHVMKYVGATLYDSGDNSIGTCDAMQYSGSVDAAFCSLSPGYEGSNHIANNFITLNPRTEAIYVGMTSNIKGMFNNSYGTVIATFISYKYNGVSFYNGSLSTYNSQSGDSGGIIYSGSNNILGIHEGRIPYGNSENPVFISADDINSALNLNLY